MKINTWQGFSSMVDSVACLKRFFEKVSAELNLETAISYSVYTELDIEIQKKRHQNQYLTMRKGKCQKYFL